MGFLGYHQLRLGWLVLILGILSPLKTFARLSVPAMMQIDLKAFEEEDVRLHQNPLLVNASSETMHQFSTAEFRARSAYKKLNWTTAETESFDVRRMLHWLPRLGVNGVLDFYERTRCHKQGHPVGHAAVLLHPPGIGQSTPGMVGTRLSDLLSACGSRCTKGCFHGLIQGLILSNSEWNETSRDKSTLGDLCRSPEVAAVADPGECFHAVGHSLMALEVERAAHQAQGGPSSGNGGVMSGLGPRARVEDGFDREEMEDENIPAEVLERLRVSDEMRQGGEGGGAAASALDSADDLRDGRAGMLNAPMDSQLLAPGYHNPNHKPKGPIEEEQWEVMQAKLGRKYKFVELQRAEHACLNAFPKDKPAQHYCGTGMYMQWFMSRRAMSPPRLASWLAFLISGPPSVGTCEQSIFPASCFLYKWRQLVNQVFDSRGKLARAYHSDYGSCLSYPKDGFNRISCLFGLSASLMEHHKMRSKTEITFAAKYCEALVYRRDQIACIDGTMFRGAKFFEDRKINAECSSFKSIEYQKLCFRIAKGGMYDLNKDFNLYISHY